METDTGDSPGPDEEQSAARSQRRRGRIVKARKKKILLFGFFALTLTALVFCLFSIRKNYIIIENVKIAAKENIDCDIEFDYKKNSLFFFNKKMKIFYLEKFAMRNLSFRVYENYKNAYYEYYIINNPIGLTIGEFHVRENGGIKKYPTYLLIKNFHNQYKSIFYCNSNIGNCHFSYRKNNNVIVSHFFMSHIDDLFKRDNSKVLEKLKLKIASSFNDCIDFLPVTDKREVRR